MRKQIKRALSVSTYWASFSFHLHIQAYILYFNTETSVITKCLSPVLLWQGVMVAPTNADRPAGHLFVRIFVSGALFRLFHIAHSSLRGADVPFGGYDLWPTSPSRNSFKTNYHVSVAYLWNSSENFFHITPFRGCSVPFVGYKLWPTYFRD